MGVEVEVVGTERHKLINSSAWVLRGGTPRRCRRADRETSCGALEEGVLGRLVPTGPVCVHVAVRPGPSTPPGPALSRGRRAAASGASAGPRAVTAGRALSPAGRAPWAPRREAVAAGGRAVPSHRVRALCPVRGSSALAFRREKRGGETPFSGDRGHAHPLRPAAGTCRGNCPWFSWKC